MQTKRDFPRREAGRNTSCFNQTMRVKADPDEPEAVRVKGRKLKPLTLAEISPASITQKGTKVSLLRL
jgi:hypothetical protein